MDIPLLLFGLRWAVTLATSADSLALVNWLVRLSLSLHTSIGLVCLSLCTTTTTTTDSLIHYYYYYDYYYHHHHQYCCHYRITNCTTLDSPSLDYRYSLVSQPVGQPAR